MLPFPTPYYMSQFDIERCVALAKHHSPITNQTRVAILNRPTTREQREARAAMLESESNPTMPMGKTVTMELTLDGDFKFAYVAELDTLYIAPRTDDAYTF